MNIKEIAKLAGVSPSTVSLVLNNKKGVGEETRKHVLSISKKYNYKIPNKKKFAKKSILFLKYTTNGMIVDENTGFISTIMDSIENDCRNQDYNLSIVISENNLEETLLSIDYDNYYGLIFLGTELESSTYPLLKEIPIPYIVVDNIMPNFDCSSIAINNHDIVYHALSHLKSQGHESIAYFRSNMAIQNFDERTESFYDTCNSLNLEFDSTNEYYLTPTLIGAYERMKEYLEKGVDLPTCAFADNDTIALGAIKALKEYNYKIPRDISVIGFDDIKFSAISSPSLTTMNIPKKLIGSLTLKLLLQGIENPDYKLIKYRVGGTIVERDSTRGV